jgi:hypothetical protein
MQIDELLLKTKSQGAVTVLADTYIFSSEYMKKYQDERLPADDKNKYVNFSASPYWITTDIRSENGGYYPRKYDPIHNKYDLIQYFSKDYDRLKLFIAAYTSPQKTYYTPASALDSADYTSVLIDAPVSIFSDGRRFVTGPTSQNGRFVTDRDGCYYLDHTNHKWPRNDKPTVDEIAFKAARIKTAIKDATEPLPEAPGGTLTAKAKKELQKYHQGSRKLKPLPIHDFFQIEHCVHSLQRDGEAATYSTAAAAWFGKMKFNTTFDGSYFVVHDHAAKIPDYYQILERFFADKMADEYKTRSVFDGRHPNNSLKISSIVLSRIDKYYRFDIRDILRQKGAENPQTTVKILDAMISASLSRREKALSFLPPPPAAPFPSSAKTKPAPVIHPDHGMD